MKLFHISHTDLDGYSCQLVTSMFFDSCEFYNSNYGDEIIAHFRDCISTISNMEKTQKYMLLFTDLNLTLDYCAEVEKSISNLKADGFDIELLLLDHHGTGVDCQAKYKWYYLDTSKSATKITYEYFKSNYKYKDQSVDVWLNPFVIAVNAVDIWLENDTSFEFGKVCLRLINTSNEINKTIFKDENIRYKFYLLTEASKFMQNDNANILLDENIYFIKKNYIKGDLANDTFDNLLSIFIESLLSSNKDYYTIEYKGHKGIVTYALGNISVIANHFLKKNPSYAFFVDVSSKGTVSLRGNNIIDVSAMAKNLFDGGGHPNASGGKIKDFKECFSYTAIKEQLINIIASNK